MIETILTTVLASAVLLKTPTAMPTASTPQVVFTRVLPERNFVSSVVGKDDTIKSTALHYYGSEGVQSRLLAKQEVRIGVVTPTVTPIITSTPAPTVTQAPTVTANQSGLSEEAITYLGNCEAGMDPAKNTGNGYYGAFQFSYGTWKSMNTGYERADLAPIEVQKAAVRQLLQRSSIYTQFPGCANKMRNVGLI